MKNERQDTHSHEINLCQSLYQRLESGVYVRAKVARSCELCRVTATSFHEASCLTIMTFWDYEFICFLSVSSCCLSQSLYERLRLIRVCFSKDKVSWALNIGLLTCIKSFWRTLRHLFLFSITARTLKKHSYVWIHISEPGADVSLCIYYIITHISVYHKS